MTNVLLLGGNTTEYHDIEIVGPVIKQILSGIDCTVTISTDMDLLLERHIHQFEVIVDYTTTRTITSQQAQGLLSAITGSHWGNTGQPKLYLGLHGATTSYLNSQRVLQMIGARFLTHPPMGRIEVAVEQPDHPIMKGMADFAITDELYLQEYYPPFQILLTSQFNNFTIPLAWVKPYGRGEVCYLALGHGSDQFQHGMVRQFITNAITHWTSKSQGKSWDQARK